MVAIARPASAPWVTRRPPWLTAAATCSSSTSCTPAAQPGDPAVAVRLQAAHLGRSDERQVVATGVEQRQRLDDERHPADRVGALVAGLLHPPDQVGHGEVEDPDQQVLLAGVVVVDARHAHVGQLGDRPHAGAVVADRHEGPDRPGQHAVDGQRREVAPVPGRHRHGGAGRRRRGRVREHRLGVGEQVGGRHPERGRDPVQPLDREPGPVVLDGAEGAGAHPDPGGEIAQAHAAQQSQPPYGGPRGGGLGLGHVFRIPEHSGGRPARAQSPQGRDAGLRDR